MISTDHLTLAFGGRTLFEDVNIKFTPGNCYGLIGANGAGKSTFLRCLAGEQEVTSGGVIVPPGERISVLRQNHFEFDEVEVLTTVIMGHRRLFEVMQEKDALYAKPDFDEADGTRSAELEGEFAEMDGWNAEANAATLLSGLGIAEATHRQPLKELSDAEKVRVLLAQAIFGEPHILLLDEPTNHLDVDSILWLEEFLLDFKHTVIVVSHDRHFLDKVCTHIADVDFQKVTLFSGNYTFWYETSQLALKQRQDANKKKEDKMKELKSFIARFSANASKSRQASSRKALLDKIELDDIKPSSRKYPYINFEPARKQSKEVLHVDGLCARDGDEALFSDLRFMLRPGERVAIVGEDAAVARFFDALAGVREADEGTLRWGQTADIAYLPKEYDEQFTADYSLIDWLRQFSKEQDESFVRGFLGRMLFSGDEAKKSANVLSGGEKVRCMLSKMMLKSPNVLLLNGPTNHLDLESITAFNNGLLRFTGSVLVASHDVQFLNSLVTRVIELAPDACHDTEMGYVEYLRDPARLARIGRG
jgi:ATPase subunit of ABC transporter with duplicated ATPase domains